MGLSGELRQEVLKGMAEVQDRHFCTHERCSHVKMGENVYWADAKMNPTHLYMGREQISADRHTKALQVRTASLRKS